MSERVKEELRDARRKLDEIVGRRRKPTTEGELDECIQTLEEVRRACALIPKLSGKDVAECCAMVDSSLGEVLARIRNRPRPEGAPR